MTNHNPKADPHLADARELGHEPRDVPLRVVWLIGGSLVVILVCSMIAMSGFSSLLGASGKPGATQGYSAGRAGSEVRMQQQRIDQQRDQQALLSSYQWIDQREKVARIPIERAMQMIADDPSLLTGSFKEQANPSAPIQEDQNSEGDENNE